MRSSLLLATSLLLTLTLTAQNSLTKAEIKMHQKKSKAFMKEGNYAYIPAGSFTRYTDGGPGMEETQKTISVNSFFMLKGELTNFDYLIFITNLEHQNPELFQKMLPDTTTWRAPLAYNEPYVEYYFRHPAYRNYPVVGVSYGQAQAYCNWLTESYHQLPERIFKKVIFRLPTEDEWIYAALGGSERNIFPWDGPYTRNSKGDLMANCMSFNTENVICDTVYQKNANGEFEAVPIYRAYPGGDYYGVAGYLNDGADVTAPSVSYWPNGFGLYNMAGNVSEMVQEPGITHGGSWNDPGAYMRITERQTYEGTSSSSNKRGFRIVVEVVEW